MSCSDRHHGIPEEVKQLSHKFDFDYSKSPWPGLHPHKIAAIVAEPTDNPDYLKFLRNSCNAWGIVFVFDEIRTGFRYDMGGAQALYGVTPDLACFGKAMANGMPISALVGKREIMSRLETPDVYYSGTFFGETLSIAAALATIKKMEEKDVIGKLVMMGTRLEFEILKLIHQFNLGKFVSLGGWYTNQSITFKGEHADRLRTLFMQTMFQEGVLIINSNNLSYAMGEPELKRIITAYRHTFAQLSHDLLSGDIAKVNPTAAAPLRVVA